MMTNLNLKSELNEVLNANEKIWKTLVNQNSPSNGCAVQPNMLAQAVTDVRAKLCQAIDLAGVMFETNMECLAHILKLKKEKSQLKTQYELKIENLKERNSMLSGIIDEQQSQIQQMRKNLCLKGTWCRLLVAHRREDDCELTEDSAIALSWLSAQCAQEILTPDESQAPFVNSCQLPNNELQQRFMNLLLEKVETLTKIIRRDSQLASENTFLRQRLNDQELSNDVKEANDDRVRLQIESSKMQCEDFRTKISCLDQALSSSREESRRQLKSIEQMELLCRTRADELIRAKRLTEESIQACEEWRILCSPNNNNNNNIKPSRSRSSSDNNNNQQDNGEKNVNFAIRANVEHRFAVDSSPVSVKDACSSPTPRNQDQIASLSSFPLSHTDAGRPQALKEPSTSFFQSTKQGQSQNAAHGDQADVNAAVSHAVNLSIDIIEPRVSSPSKNATRSTSSSSPSRARSSSLASPASYGPSDYSTPERRRGNPSQMQRFATAERKLLIGHVKVEQKRHVMVNSEKTGTSETMHPLPRRMNNRKFSDNSLIADVQAAIAMVNAAINDFQ